MNSDELTEHIIFFIRNLLDHLEAEDKWKILDKVIKALEEEQDGVE